LRVTVTTSLSVCNLELQIHIKSRRGIKNDVVASPSFIVKGSIGVTHSLMRSAETNNKKKFNEDLVPYPASGFSVLKGGDLRKVVRRCYTEIGAPENRITGLKTKS